MMSSLIINRLSIKLRSGSDNLVSEISFAIKEGESLILLGQSGSGKTMTCSAVLNLLDPKKFEVSGSVLADRWMKRYGFIPTNPASSVTTIFCSFCMM